MRFAAPFFRARRAQNVPLCNSNELTPSGSWTAFTFGCISSFLLIFAAASMNAGHAWQLGIADGEFRAAVLAGASIGAAIMAPLAFLAVHRGRGFGTRSTALMLAIGALLYTSASSLGFISQAKDHGISDRVTVSDRYADHRAVAVAARAELAGLKGQTPAVLKRRRELTALLAGKSTVAAAPVKADAQAAALGFYLRAAGWTVTDQAVGTWLSLFMVLFLEAGAALSLTVAAALKPVRLARPTAPSMPAGAQLSAEPEKPARDEKTGPADDDDEQPPTPPRRGRPGRPRDVLPAEAVAKIRAAGGRMSGSVNGIGKLLGTKSKTTAHRLLAELSRAGLITLRTTPHGCAVALA
jgi:hypothetical protein